MSAILGSLEEEHAKNIPSRLGSFKIFDLNVNCFVFFKKKTRKEKSVSPFNQIFFSLN